MNFSCPVGLGFGLGLDKKVLYTSLVAGVVGRWKNELPRSTRLYSLHVYDSVDDGPPDGQTLSDRHHLDDTHSTHWSIAAASTSRHHAAVQCSRSNINFSDVVTSCCCVLPATAVRISARHAAAAAAACIIGLQFNVCACVCDGGML